MFTTSALANTASSAPVAAANPLATLLQFGLIFLIFFIFLILPGQKRAKAHAQMLASIQKGDRIVFGGMVGTVKKVVDEEILMVEVAKDVEVKVLRSLVCQVVTDSSVINKK